MTSKFNIYGIIESLDEDQWGLNVFIKSSSTSFPIQVRVSKKSIKLLEKAREELAVKTEGMFEGMIFSNKSKIPALLLSSYTLRMELLQEKKTNNNNEFTSKKGGSFYNNRFKKNEDGLLL